MTNKLVAAAGVDPAAEKDGAWFEYGAGGLAFNVKLARAGSGNPEFMKLQNRLLKPWRSGAKGGGSMDIPHETDRRIMRELYAKTIVKDWDATQFGQPFTIENCIDTMRDLNDFLDWVINISNAQENYRKAELEEAAGN